MTRPPVVIALLAALLLPGTAAAAPPLEDRYIVVLKDSADSANVANEHGRKYGVTNRLVYGSALEGYAGKVPPGQLAKIKSDPRVKYVEPDGLAYASVTQSGATWGLDRIDQRSLPLNGTYTYTQTGAGVTAYVIDTGIRITHSEFDGLAANRASHGAEFVNDSSTADDCDGHGTHVAGTIGGSTWGVAKGVNLVAVRVLDCNGSGAWSWVISGINWVTQQHDPGEAAVANMSLGGSAIQSVDDAVANSIADGVTYSVSAGNSRRDACNYSPARTPSALTIGSTTSSDSRSSFSNYGNCVDWFAPGSSIRSANMTGGSLTLSGTSMSSPHTAGAAALHLQTNPSSSPAAVRSALASALTTGVVTNANSAANHLLFVNGGGGTVTPPPDAGFTASCNGLTCTFDSTSTGSITSYSWNFGDSSAGSGSSTTHTYAAAGDYNVMLTVTGPGGMDSASQVVAVTAPSSGGFTLDANGFKVKGVHHAQLTWSGAEPGTHDILMNGVDVGNVTGASGSVDHNINRKGGGSYVFQLCSQSSGACSNTSPVNF